MSDDQELKAEETLQSNADTVEKLSKEIQNLKEAVRIIVPATSLADTGKDTHLLKTLED